MAFTIDNPEIERLADEVAGLAHEDRANAIRTSLIERKARLRQTGKPPAFEDLQRFLEESVWPRIPSSELGRVITREEEDRILGYDAEGF